jgi:RTX calcium-binding nonapeptide repeat (4 copies)
MNRSLLAASVTAALLLPASAGASTVSSAPVSGSIYFTTFQAGPGPSDVTLAGNGRTWSDAAQTLTAGANCSGSPVVTCPQGDAEVFFRGGADRLTNTFSFFGLKVHGAGGNDTITANGNLTEVWGDAGADHVNVDANGTSLAHGGLGADELRGGFPHGNGTKLDGGDGPDLVVGNSLNDKLVEGDDGLDQLFSVLGLTGLLDGGLKADTLVSLGAGNPAFLGTITLNGGDGPDTIQGGPTTDVFDGGNGADVIDVYDGDPSARADNGVCGPGIDTVYADATDTIGADCENVIAGPAPALPAVDAAIAHLTAAFPDTPLTYTP